MRLASRFARATDRYACPICESSFAAFEPGRNRPSARCPSCGSLERHRLAWLFLQRETDLFGPRRQRLLHLAPEPMIQKRFRALRNVEHLSIDLESRHADENMDITQLRLGDESFDCCYCSHVLEHIPDDRAAMSELLRVLRPGGWGLLMVPIHRETTYEDPAIVDPSERLAHFGQADHVRRYGRDFADRLRSVGLSVDEVSYGGSLDEATVERNGLNPTELLHFCRRPGDAAAARSEAPGRLRRLAGSRGGRSAG